MTRKPFILLLLAAAFTACSSAQLPPIDDVYYWDKHEQKAVQPAAAESPAVTTEQTPASTPSTPQKTIEYVNVQDTTVTIRIR
jgi:hypothetical protein